MPVDQESSLAPSGDFGIPAGAKLEGVYIDTGENGFFSADEFAAITSLDQMQLITPEEVARTVVAELLGGNTGRDIVAALDGAVSGPSYRGGYLRQAALARLRQLESVHGQSVAYEVLGPPRLSKLLYEAHLLKSSVTELSEVIGTQPDALSELLSRRIGEDTPLRRRIISIGIPILLPDGKRLIRGPVIKTDNAHSGWVDLTPENMGRWQARLSEIGGPASAVVPGSSSREAQRFGPAGANLEPGDLASWIFLHEEGGERKKS